MAKTIDQRIRDSFQGDDSAAQAKEYGQRVYETWKDISDSLSRSAIAFFLLMALFEVLAYQRQSVTVSIGSFNLVDAPIVLVFLPAIVAFVLYDGMGLSERWLDLESAYMELVKIYSRKQWDNDLDLLVKPHLSSLWSLGSRPASETARPGDVFMSGVRINFAIVVIILVPVAFECQAYYRLIQKFGYDVALLWVSVLLTTLLLICTYIYLFLQIANEARKDDAPES
jgi:hypothetical protein